MRDPERIPVIIRLLQEAWERDPDLRFGQLVVHVIGDSKSRDGLHALFNVEDDLTELNLREWLEDPGHGPPKALD